MPGATGGAFLPPTQTPETALRVPGRGRRRGVPAWGDHLPVHKYRASRRRIAVARAPARATQIPLLYNASVGPDTRTWGVWRAAWKDRAHSGRHRPPDE